jgi:hypothetical protein
MSFKKIKIEISPGIKELADIPGVFIAGGAVRSLYEKQTPRDIDIFSNSQAAYEEALKSLPLKGYGLLFTNQMLSRFKKTESTSTTKVVEGKEVVVIPEVIETTIDLVVPRKGEYLCTFGTPEEVISFFDFTVARAALLSNNEALVDVRFEDDIKSRILHIENIVCPLMAGRRIFKYLNKGYQITTKETLKLFLEFEKRQMSTGRVVQLLQSTTTLTESEANELLTGLYID